MHDFVALASSNMSCKVAGNHRQARNPVQNLDADLSSWYPIPLRSLLYHYAVADIDEELPGFRTPKHIHELQLSVAIPPGMTTRDSIDQ